MYNWSGATFSILDVMGTFRMNEANEIIKIEATSESNENGASVYQDLAGHLVNEKGYLITTEGHICTRNGKLIFIKDELKNGEFPKIFPFSRMNLS